jgi:hypothetical protein
MTEEQRQERQQYRGSGNGASTPEASQGAGLGGRAVQPAFDVRMALFAGAGLLAAALLGVGYFDDRAPTKSSNEQTSLMKPVTEAETDRAVSHLLMGSADKDRVREEVSSGRLRLAWITVADSFAEDGDWIRLEAAGFHQDIRLLNKPYEIAVPYLPGSMVTVTGLVDGIDGDITVAVHVGGATVSLKPLKQGEELRIPTP